jgi:tRNA uridine 5-carboxymethylaminomethyl modification enzyme
MSAARAAADIELRPDRSTNQWLAAIAIELSTQTSFAKLLERPGVEVDALLDAVEGAFPALASTFRALTAEEREGVVSQLRYAGYIERQQREASRMREDEELRIPKSMDFNVPGLSREVVEKLTRVQPVSLGQAARIPGITPAAVAIVRMHLRRGSARTI